MDGVLERIDEDEEQKTDQSAITDPEENEGALEMRTVGKDSYEDQPATTNTNIGDGNMMSSANAPHELDSQDESLA